MRPSEKLSNEELIAEKYRGIRPAPGYPAQPDHTEKAHHLPPARRRGRRPASSSPRASPCGRARPSPASISRIPTATTSASARSSATRSRTTRARKGWTRRGGGALARPRAQLRSQARPQRGGLIGSAASSVRRQLGDRAGCNFGGSLMLSRLILLAAASSSSPGSRRPIIVRYIPGLGRLAALRLRGRVRRAGLGRRPGAVRRCCARPGSPRARRSLPALVVALIAAALITWLPVLVPDVRASMRAHPGAGLSADRGAASAITSGDSVSRALAVHDMTKARDLCPAPLLPSMCWWLCRSSLPSDRRRAASKLRTCRRRLQSGRRRIRWQQAR